MLKIFGMFILMVTATFAQTAEKYVLLETAGGSTKPLVLGDSNLLKQAAMPASTFKILISWAGIEEGLVKPDTKHLCNDKHITGMPRELTLQEAMYESSNDYFIWLSAQIGAAKLEKYIRKSQFASIPEGGWVEPDLKGVVGGGKLKVTPEQQHAFIQKIAKSELTSSPKVQDELEKALTWPSSDAKVKLYGKTGTFGGAVWYNGYGRENGQLKFVTIYVPYVAPDGATARKKAIELFYSRFNQTPTPAK